MESVWMVGGIHLNGWWNLFWDFNQTIHTLSQTMCHPLTICFFSCLNGILLPLVFLCVGTYCIIYDHIPFNYTISLQITLINYFPCGSCWCQMLWLLYFRMLTRSGTWSWGDRHTTPWSFTPVKGVIIPGSILPITSYIYTQLFRGQ